MGTTSSCATDCNRAQSRMRMCERIRTVVAVPCQRHVTSSVTPHFRGHQEHPPQKIGMLRGIRACSWHLTTEWIEGTPLRKSGSTPICRAVSQQKKHTRLGTFREDPLPMRFPQWASSEVIHQTFVAVRHGERVCGNRVAGRCFP